MDKNNALDALAALGQETRLDVFRLLVKAGPDGLSAGAVSETLDVRPNTLSTHFGLLTRSGMISAERDGRSIVYRADLSAMQKLVTYLLQDCCGGNPELCAPLLNVLSCVPQKDTEPTPA
ncbi:helix-turn-helix transcriptional regulator [Roseibium sp. CAU 1637]|uniref:Helix-turn-helix transcriptional regulator n=1 Tax=Roseibium limicola TaxID=2816037 RepID=A0A939J6H5_9HYPH|nr:helix-turn-helix domain-containing protein [Roseibium limicola]MBO0346865.1 helix-turn-helix transcriptional regulator [Roseibium limicola]